MVGSSCWRLRPLRTAHRLAALAGFAFVLPLFGQTKYAITDLGSTGEVQIAAFLPNAVQARGLSPTGAVTAYNASAGGTVKRAFLYANGSAQNLGTLGGSGSEGYGVNAAGDVVGYSLNDSGAQRAFVFRADTMSDLGTLGGNTAIAYAINRPGQIVGTSRNAAQTDRGFLYSNGAMQDIGTLGGANTYPFAINDAGQIAGASKLGNTADHAFLYTGGVMRDLGTLGGSTSYAYGLNEAGHVVGVSASAANTQRAFLFANDTLKDLGFVATGDRAQANAINNLGQIVGWSTITAGGTSPRAFLYQNETMTNLSDFNQILGNATARFLTLTTANAINDAGQIVGYGLNADATYHIFLLTPTLPPTAPTVFPASVTVATGATVRLQVSNPLAGVTYAWSRAGVSGSIASGSALLIPNATATQAGIYLVTATNLAGTATSLPATVAVVTSSDVGRLTNLSIRTNAGTGSEVLIVGFVIGGQGTTGTKPVLIRAIGPSLTAFGVPGVLVDPLVTAYRGATVVGTNDSWNDDPQVGAVSATVGAFALASPTSKDAALYRPTLAADSYTVQITGNSGTGIALAEIYDATAGAFSPATPRLANVSARARVGAADQILISGFVVGGATAKTVLIRAVGPTLAAFGVAGALADPKLELLRDGVVVASNDNWGGEATIVTLGVSVGAFALSDANSRDSVLLVSLPPGAYTAQVSGVGGTTGVGLVEVYEIP